jgi:hypothetical protein
MWPAADAHLSDIDKSIRKSIEAMEAYINDQLAKNPRLPLGS